MRPSEKYVDDIKHKLHFRVIRIMLFIWTERMIFPYMHASSRLIKCSFFINSTTPYILPRFDSQIEPNFSDCSPWTKWLKGTHLKRKVQSLTPRLIR